MSRIRCFVAAALPEATREQLGALQGRLRRAGLPARWVRPEALHLTLKFLGELPPAVFDQVAEQLFLPLDGAGPLRLTPRGVGTVPPDSRARVVWAGLEGDVAALARLALTVEARVQGCGVARERRPFQSHLTLGRATRLGGLGDVREILETEAGFEAPPFVVRELVLYESRLRGQGPSYVPRLTLPLSDDPFPG
ncbi:MAG TPA: RNA 2',3'-cyclic phosphodiesterase [Deferrisomatales bacterium]|nr:RNA 2',3'-cyclic phosphodiesterase [Deferrisomatales bacterium]